MNSKQWSLRAWQAAAPVYQAILRLPFLNELADGTLSRERFLRYIGQDSLYLGEYSRVLAHIASRLQNIAHTDTFLKFAADGVATEKALHSGYLSQPPAGKSPACLFYTSLLKAQAYEHVAVEAASILPCFWIYREVGCHILSIAKLEGNPYADWIRTYSDPTFDAATARAIEICDTLAQEATPDIRNRMTEIFIQCSRLEWLFWHTAYSPLEFPE